MVDLDGQIVPVGRKGELCIRGFIFMSGYWNEYRTDQQSTGTGSMVQNWVSTVVGNQESY